MLLAIDIGNSTVKFGVFDGENLVSRFTIPTNSRQTAEEINNLTKENLITEIDAVIISSVVPESNDSFRKLSERYLNIKPIFADYTFDFELKINYESPETLGIDRIIAAFAATEKYGKPCVVCDFGTATTIDSVNASGEFMGGIIAPGMNLLADALFQKTSKLPKVEIKKPESVFGNTTVGSLQSGIYFGYTSLVDGIVRRMIDELAVKPKIVATGGLVKVIAESSEMIDVVDENLMLEGLRFIYEKELAAK